MSGIEEFYVHTVTVETWQGTGSMGDVYDPGAQIVGFLDGKAELVRDAEGQQVMAASTFFCSTVDGAKFTPDSKVTVSSPGSLSPGGSLAPGGSLVPSSVAGRVCRVVSQNVLDAPGLDLPDHSRIYLK